MFDSPDEFVSDRLVYFPAKSEVKNNWIYAVSRSRLRFVLLLLADNLILGA